MTKQPVLYLVVCAAPPALQIGELIDLLMTDGWAVCVIATPTAATWLDRDALADQTGHPVRVQWRLPGEPDVHPKADVVMVAPATFNTINKWALGISDNLALGILNEVIGSDLPVLAFPCVKQTLVSHPAYGEHVQRLRDVGVDIDGEAWKASSASEAYNWPGLTKRARSSMPRSKLAH